MSTFTPVAKISAVTAIMLGFIPACALESRDQRLDIESNDATAEQLPAAPLDEATIAGQGMIAPPPPEAFLRPVHRRDPDFDGALDVELQEFVALAPGVEQWAPVRGEGGAVAAMNELAMGPASSASTGSSLVGVVTDRGHYLVRIEDESMMVETDRDALRALPGRSDGAASLPAEDDDVEFRGWSNGVDNRTRRTGNNVHVSVGMVSTTFGQCSGSLIGRRLVRTAAHCVINHTAGGGTEAGSVTFDYRRDAGTTPISTTTTAYHYGGAYLGNSCGTRTATDQWSGYRNNFDACTWADWAILILDDNWHNGGLVTWFGYDGLGTDALTTELQSSGYPGCGLAESPTGCVNQANYRDNTADCNVVAWTNGTSKWRTGCDVTPGNSGGPVWQEGTDVFLGHFQWQNCTTCPQGSANRGSPNHYLGHDDWLLNFQNELREENP